MDLYNFYIESKDEIQIKHALDSNDIQIILDGIKEGFDEVFIDGRTLKIGYFDTILIFDNSKLLNTSNKSAVKHELNQYSYLLKIKGIELLKYAGMDMTHKFEIVKPSKEKLKMESIETLLPSNKNKKLFISHSSLDKVIVKKFIDLVLILGMGLKRENIFCTSDRGTDIKSGENFKEVIKKELLESMAVLQIITKNYKASEACLNEMGAAWVISNKVIPLVADPFNFDVGFIHSNSQQLKLNSSEDLIKLYQDHKRVIFSSEVNLNVLNEKIHEFITWLNLQQPSLPRPVEVKEIDNVLNNNPLYKLKGKRGYYLNQGKALHLFPDETNDLTLRLMGFDKSKLNEIQSFNGFHKGADLQSVVGARIVRINNNTNSWLILNNKRYHIPNQATLNFLLQKCSCQVEVIDQVNLLNLQQEDDLKSLKELNIAG